jgi:GNAT superfamily N-acetyltransferase
MNQRHDFEIDETFRAERTLRDGTGVVIRTLRPSDRELLVRGFDRLSETSRYQRFLAIKPSLTDRDLGYLFDVDNIGHMAIGAVIEHEFESAHGRAEEGVGLARFVRYDDQPTVAEVAVAVVDDYQGKGLGRLLLSYLVPAARERGIKAFRADCFSTNFAMRALFEEIGPTEVLERAGPVITLDIPFDESVDDVHQPRFR